MKEKTNKANPCFGNAHDSKAVVGLGERTLLPRHVREYCYHEGLQGVKVLCCVLLLSHSPL